MKFIKVAISRKLMGFTKVIIILIFWLVKSLPIFPPRDNVDFRGTLYIFNTLRSCYVKCYVAMFNKKNQLPIDKYNQTKSAGI